MPTPEEVKDALRNIYDPEIPINIVDLGLVYECKVEGDQVTVVHTLTTPGCGMAGMIGADIKERVAMLPDVKDVQVEIVWEPAWNPDMISDEAKEVLGL